MSMLARSLVFLLLLPVLGWCALVLGYTIPGPPLAGKLLAGGAVVVGLLGFRVLGSFARGCALVAAIFAAVLLWYLSLEPPQEAHWQPDVARLPRATLVGDQLTIENVRDFDYRSETDYTPRWETRTYDLSKLDGVDMFFSHWSGPAIAHTIVSWSFSDGQHLAISIETRKVVGQEYSAVAGFFRQYPIYYVVADERDVVRLRTNYRGEHVWMYRVKPARPGAARAFLLDYLASVNALAERPAWYNALTDNCTTTIHQHARHLNPGANPFDWRLLANGYLPELLYEQGRLESSLPFDELERRSRIDARAKAADQDPDFSARIRAVETGN
ncbi:MAG TPA: DUF4105 domain-containing protein [Myxococcota bacterium]|jgi:hypothetical protein|nr:DUF4105 domain-containing protein [Myxococcota bacterium]